MAEGKVEPIKLELSGITKVYPGVVALQDVDLNVSGGTIVGLIGENGAGKSTLMNILGGLVSPDFGNILVDNQIVNSLTPTKAAGLGIAFVHQELHPFANLDVAGNILLGREITKGLTKRLDRQAMIRLVQPILTMLGARFGPDDSVADLSIADQQILEIAKALSMNARLIIMDEPTSSLTFTEAERLLSVMKRLREQGVAILFISHRLSEIEETADRVVCLRDGVNVGDLRGEEINKGTMIRLMIGRDVNSFYEKERHNRGKPVLEFQDVQTTANPGATVNLTLYAGEILGLAGLVGAGRTELAHAAFGVDPVLRGKVILNGLQLEPHSVFAAMSGGLCLVPENRKEHGLFLDFPITQNISLPSLKMHSKAGFVNIQSERTLAEASQQKLSIKVASLNSAVAELSGGNQQKVVLAKWLALNPQVIIFDEPTRGIDVGAKSDVYHLMQALTENGVGILMISSDMEEVIGVSDRVAVMSEGHITGILNAVSMTEENILQLAVGRNPLEE
jgi:ribose transport system ATP-binding protein